MKNILFWEQFLKTGAVEDYLSYRNTGFLQSADIKINHLYQDRADRQENLNAGFSIGDRNGDQDRTDWRV